MICPKCRAVQPDGSEECTSCGIMFARWRPTRERELPPRVPPSTPPRLVVPEPARPMSTLATALIGTAFVLFVLFGIHWTMQRKAEREKTDPAAMGDALLNDINNHQVQRRMEMEAKAVSVAYKLPQGLDEQHVMAMIEQCDHFQHDLILKIPKRFRRDDMRGVSQQYPALPIAVREKLIEIDSPPISEWLPSVRSSYNTTHITPSGLDGGDIRNYGDFYQIELGRPVVGQIRQIQNWDNNLKVEFAWKYSGPHGDVFEPNRRNAYATFVENHGEWTLHSLDLWDKNGLKSGCS